MFFGDTPQDTRKWFYSSWRKYRQRQALIPLEQQLVDVILSHPEYHFLFDQDEIPEEASSALNKDDNPFLHLGLHLALREQIATDRPLGVRHHFQRLLTMIPEPLHVEHLMMHCLAECLWQAQHQQSEPDSASYLQALSRLPQATRSKRIL